MEHPQFLMSFVLGMLLMTLKHRGADAGPCWDFDLDRSFTSESSGWQDLHSDFNAFGNVYDRILVCLNF